MRKRIKRATMPTFFFGPRPDKSDDWIAGNRDAEVARLAGPTIGKGGEIVAARIIRWNVNDRNGTRPAVFGGIRFDAGRGQRFEPFQSNTFRRIATALA